MPSTQKNKESKLFKDLEKQQTYGTAQQTDVEPQETKPSTFTQIMARRPLGVGIAAWLPQCPPDQWLARRPTWRR